MNKSIGQLYYWLSLLINHALPLILLLIMNSFIIHTLCKRSKLAYIHDANKTFQGQGHSQSEGQSSKNEEI